LVTSWEKAIAWEKIAANRIAKYKRAGLALCGARYREGISQKKLAKRCNISQDNLSKIENGKRAVGEKVAKRLAKALHFDYRLLLA
jgi:transcriptional regulator with XRE-family HTH domain